MPLDFWKDFRACPEQGLKLGPLFSPPCGSFHCCVGHCFLWPGEGTAGWTLSLGGVCGLEPPVGEHAGAHPAPVHLRLGPASQLFEGL